MEIQGLSKKYTFREAVPVWEKGHQLTKNHSLIFRAVIEGNEEIKLSIASHSRYQIFVDGVFYAAGPARAGHGFYRVNEYTLKNELSEKKTIISIIAAGYNVNSFYLLDMPSFLCAEIERNNEIIYSTGKKDFEVSRYCARIQKTPRYSFQRPFTECYILDAYYDLFMTDAETKLRAAELEKTEDKSFIERTSPYCLYSERKVKEIVSKGILIPDKDRRYFKDRSLRNIDDELKGFKEKELDASPVNELYAYKTQIMEDGGYGMESVSLGINCCCIYDMGQNNTGYIRLSLTAEHDTVIYAVFNEILPDGKCPDPGKDACENVIKWAIQGGRTYDIVSFEPYTFRYIQIISMYSPTLVTNVSLYEECYPETLVTNTKKMPTENLQKIYDAAVSTFRQNSTDIFMDCPSRERAGWLCDSFFTARVEKELTGKSLVEHDFIENFIIPEKFKDIPDGMLPMCYPADHYDGCYIHNWAFWFVLQLKGYLERSGDRKLIDAAKKRVYELLEFTKKYENKDGLLQKIDSWIFVEWSEANDFVLDINYPSNMLYSKVLDTVAELYCDETLHTKAENLRRTIREKSFDGEFFCDNAKLTITGNARRTKNHSETCQYYAFFTKTATKEMYPELYEKMFTVFGPDRNPKTTYPKVPVSNAFIGNYLRLFILFEDGEYDKMLKEIESFFLPMAEKTGTLWENMTDYASCCHGFASHVAYWLNKITE
ncbi:MAG: family 78 glycoside hydrolase catalytic domain [Clostridia bacterium]|nr:family 78 glycoside hydrolase catalytic domain [Clostridia bacterium]